MAQVSGQSCGHAPRTIRVSFDDEETLMIDEGKGR
jgi:hypothetical protein